MSSGFGYAAALVCVGGYVCWRLHPVLRPFYEAVRDYNKNKVTENKEPSPTTPKSSSEGKPPLTLVK